jgi:hypothetical protein
MTTNEAREAWRRAEDDLQRQRMRMDAAVDELRAAARDEAVARIALDAAFWAWSAASAAERAGVAL